MADSDTRPLRGCDVCGGVDDHPRHVFAHGPGDGVTPPSVASQMVDNCPDATTRTAILAHIQDDSTTYRHMDCCRQVGCPDGTCNVVTSGAEDLKGDDLVKHLTGPKAAKAAAAAGYTDGQAVSA